MSRRNPVPSYIYVVGIMSMLAHNGLASLMGRPRIHSAQNLGKQRTALLLDPFFDPRHRPEEIQYRGRAGPILWMDAIVLLARLMRVLMRRDPLTVAEVAERIDVRNEVLSQPFFDRRRRHSLNFWSDENLEDEGVVV